LRAPPCGVGFFVHVGTSCVATVGPERATQLLSGASGRLGEGAPGAVEVLAAVALQRGEALWRLGMGPQAAAALLAGVPVSDRPDVSLPNADAWSNLRRLGGPGFTFSEPVATGEPARPLFVLGHLMRAAGETDRATAYWDRARDLGLSEASGL